MKRICTICARGGSRGVPGKNIRLLGNKPLISWSIEQARESGLFDVIAVSSDSDEILRIAKEAGADLAVTRPAEMATDTASKLPAIRHCALSAEKHLGVECDIIVDLQPTSPLRLVSDITGAIELLQSSGAESIITGAPSKCSPYFSLVEEALDGTVHLSKKLEQPVVRRQDAPTCFDMNGSIYVWRREPFISEPAVLYPGTRLFEMPEERSIDIDTELDFTFTQFVLNTRSEGS